MIAYIVKWLQTHPCLKGNLREASARAFSLLVLQVLPMTLSVLHVFLQGLPMLYDTLTCI